jgi:homospermidine synthase
MQDPCFRGRVVMLGLGCVGRGVLPLLLQHLHLEPGRLVLISPDSPALRHAAAQGHPVVPKRVTRDNLDPLLARHLRPGDLLLNLSVGVDSVPLIAWARQHGALYVDTAQEPWADEAGLPVHLRTNLARRRAVLRLGRRPGSPTAVLCHGANPGLVSHFAKEALLHLGRQQGLSGVQPARALEWARLARQLGVRTIHIAERDTQWSNTHRLPGEFVNTWSVRGFIEEAMQPAEIGWGTHERQLPPDGHRHRGPSPGIWLSQPGAVTRALTWTPHIGPTLGLVITHMEALTMAHWLTIGPVHRPHWRPTVHYAYRPCDDALLSLHELAGAGWRLPTLQRHLGDDIVGGADELGVLIGGPSGGALWLGSRLTAADARQAAPGNNATTLQVAAGVMAAAVWATRHPDRGLLEPEDLPHDEILSLARPYLGTVAALRTDWTPLDSRGPDMNSTPDPADPWQFRNARVS